MQSTQKTQDTEQFFNQWAIYQRVIEKNYMVHTEIAAALQRFLHANSSNGIKYLDLGCGDAYMAAKVLPNIELEQYWGVDLSSVALQYAKTKLTTLSCMKHFVNYDLSLAITQNKAYFDIICAGYSLHHLKRDEKQLFFKDCAEALKPNSHFLMYDLVRLESETRQQCLQRHWQIYRQWGFSDAEFDLIKTHVFEQDYAESPQSLSTIAKSSGFKTMEILFTDQHQLFAVYCFSN